MATAIPLALDGGLRQPKVVVCAILALWEHGNQKQTQVFVTVPYYFRMQVQKEIADAKTNIR